MARLKIRRNDKCPCGSGHKFKYCCGASAPALRRRRRSGLEELPATVYQQFADAQRKEADRVRRFGHGKPIISVEQEGYRIVAVGTTLRWSKKWRTVHDFLSDYIKQCIGADWGNAELQKPFEERHPVIQWYRDLCDLQRRTIREPGKIFDAIATGPVRAYYSLAYDLYTLEHNSRLHKKLVERLRIKDQFQGVRYEIAVAATFIRAGFDIEFEDEEDSTTSHCEFIATHRSTGSQFSIEAKSRGRPGLLGKSGTRRPIADIRADIYRLLQEALKKSAKHRRIVFIDVNMPPVNGLPYDRGWLKTLSDQMKRMEETQDSARPWSAAFVVLTNHPYHYVGNEEAAPGGAAMLSGFNMPDLKKEIGDGDMSKLFANYPAIGALLTSIIEHTLVPADFN